MPGQAGSRVLVRVGDQPGGGRAGLPEFPLPGTRGGGCGQVPERRLDLLQDVPGELHADKRGGGVDVTGGMLERQGVDPDRRPLGRSLDPGHAAPVHFDHSSVSGLVRVGRHRAGAR
jgi:hypothetical protein